MILYYFRMAMQQLYKRKASLLLNMLGIVIVAIAAMLIGLWIHDSLLFKR